MLISNLALVEHCDYLAEKFKVGCASLYRPDLAGLPAEKIELEQGVTTSVQEYTTVPADEGKYETHGHYFGIRYIVAGREDLHLAPRDALEEKILYDAKRDITVYRSPKTASQVILSWGELIVVALEEAYVPEMIVGEPYIVKRIVLKVPIS